MSQFDLSQYPKITQPSTEMDQEELARRSEGLNRIHTTAVTLIDQIQTYLGDLVALDTRSKVLDTREIAIKQGEHDLYLKEQDVYSLEAKTKSEKEYIEKANLDLRERESKLLEQKQYLEEIEKAKKEWE